MSLFFYKNITVKLSMVSELQPWIPIRQKPFSVQRRFKKQRKALHKNWTQKFFRPTLIKKTACTSDVSTPIINCWDNFLNVNLKENEKTPTIALISLRSTCDFCESMNFLCRYLCQAIALYSSATAVRNLCFHKISFVAHFYCDIDCHILC